MVFTERQKTELKTLICDNIQAAINNMINDTLFIDGLVNKISYQVSQKINAQLTVMETKIEKLDLKVETLKRENNELKLKMDEIEQHNNLKKLRIYGLPKDTTVPLNTQITQLIERKLELKDISPVQCYRLGSSITGDSRSSESRNRNSAVIAIFDSLQQRNTVFYNKKSIKKANINS